MSKTRVTKETQLNVMSLIYSNERVFFISARSSEHCCALCEPLTDCGTHQPIQGQQSSPVTHSLTGRQSEIKEITSQLFSLLLCWRRTIGEEWWVR